MKRVEGCQISLERVPPDSTTIPTKILRSRPLVKTRLHAVVLTAETKTSLTPETQSSFLEGRVKPLRDSTGVLRPKSRAQRIWDLSALPRVRWEVG